MIKVSKTLLAGILPRGGSGEDTVITGNVISRVASVSDGTTYYPHVNWRDDNGDAALLLLDGDNNPTLRIDSNLRFANLDIPAGATIKSAKITLTSASPKSTTAPEFITIGTEQVDNASPITNGTTHASRLGNIGDSVEWYIDTLVAEDKAESPDLSEIIQEIIDRPGWSSGNAIMFFTRSYPQTRTWTNSPEFYNYRMAGGVEERLPLLELEYEMKFFIQKRRRPIEVEAEEPPPPPDVTYQTLSYTEDTTTNILNPERGWHSAVENTAQFSSLRGSGMTLTRWLGRLDNFTNSAISNQWLQQHAQVFAAARSAGIKLELRYAYSYNPPPPIPDAPLSRILEHIGQLGPVWEDNYDVISSLQAGFVGRWGEWNASGYGLMENADPTERNQIISALLNNLPEERMISLRYPELHAGLLTGNSLTMPTPVSAAEAFTGTNPARLGMLNDSFLANHTDGGTFVINRFTEDYATNSTSKQYWRDISRYVVTSGETVDLDWRDGNREAGAASIAEMEQFNWDVLNREYSTRVINGWISSGHYDEITRRIGYRLSLVEATLPETAPRGALVNVSIRMKNSGFGKVYNPRPAQLVLSRGGSSTRLELTPDARRDLPLGGETVTMDYEVAIPGNMTPGDYTLSLALPDPSDNLSGDSRYSIRFANTGGLWSDNHGGVNGLNCNLEIL